MRLAYADPPYLGVAAKHYAAHHAEAAKFDSVEEHAALIARLVRDYDGYAVSMGSNNLHTLLPFFPPTVRVAAWVKPFASFKKGVAVAYAWEPVVFKPARKRPSNLPTVRDWIAHNITMQRGLPGAKPLAFCEWVLDLLGYEKGDDLDDLFPGTGVMSSAARKDESAIGGLFTLPPA